VAREAAVRGVAPRHRRACLIAVPPRRDPPRDRAAPTGRRIDDLGARDRDVAKPDLLAVIQERRAAQRQQEHRGALGDRISDAHGRSLGKARHVARLVVIGQDDRRPATLAEDRLALRGRLGKRVRAPRLFDEVEVEDEVALRRVRAGLPWIRREQLANGHPAAAFVDDRPELGEEFLQLGLVLVVGVALPVVRPTAQHPARVRRQLDMLEERVEDVEPEAVDAAIEPAANHVEHRGADVGVAPVEVRLLGQERVQIELAPFRVPSPGRATEIRDPVVRSRPPP
jgi:hypothetical protein